MLVRIIDNDDIQYDLDNIFYGLKMIKYSRY